MSPRGDEFQLHWRKHSMTCLVVLATASFKAASTLSHDEVTSFIRQPFVRGHAHSGEGEEPVEGGMEQAIGELVTCTRCIGTWVAAGCLGVTIIAAGAPFNYVLHARRVGNCPAR